MADARGRARPSTAADGSDELGAAAGDEAAPEPNPNPNPYPYPYPKPTTNPTPTPTPTPTPHQQEDAPEPFVAQYLHAQLAALPPRPPREASAV